MNSKGIKWLYNELPKLILNNVIGEEQAQKIKEYYGTPDETNWLKIMLGIFGTLGAILIGSGIILIFARNWEELSIPARTVLSLAPLLIAQMLGVFVLLKKKDSIPWREAISVFLTLSIGASISLIGQTYNIEGDMASFLITWMLLTVPIVYLFDAVVPSVFYLAGITFWAGYVQSEHGQAAFYWILFATLIPYVIKNLRIKKFSNRSTLLQWVIAINLCVSLGIVLEKVLPGLWIVVYSSFFAILILIDKLVEKDFESLWERPLLVVGTIGTLVIAFLLML